MSASDAFIHWLLNRLVHYFEPRTGSCFRRALLQVLSLERQPDLRSPPPVPYRTSSQGALRSTVRKWSAPATYLPVRGSEEVNRSKLTRSWRQGLFSGAFCLTFLAVLREVKGQSGNALADGLIALALWVLFFAFELHRRKRI